MDGEIERGGGGGGEGKEGGWIVAREVCNRGIVHGAGNRRNLTSGLISGM